jgi:hypothetical protein
MTNAKAQMSNECQSSNDKTPGKALYTDICNLNGEPCF